MYPDHQAARQLTCRYDDTAFDITLELFHRNSYWVRRITETVAVVDDCLKRSITQNLTIPNVSLQQQAQSQALVVPLMRARRGRLFDNLDVTDSA